MKAFLLHSKPEIVTEGGTFQEQFRRQVISETLQFVWDRGQRAYTIIKTPFGALMFLRKKSNAKENKPG